MKHFIPVLILIIVIVIGVFLFVISDNPKIQDILEFIKIYIDILIPIGIVLLSYFGIRKWKDEIIAKRDYELSGDIFSLLINFVIKFKGLRNWWPYLHTINKDTELSIKFEMEEIIKRMNEVESSRDELINKIEEADIIWGTNLLDEAQDLFNLYSDYDKATHTLWDAINGEQGGEFTKAELANEQFLKLLINFRSPIDEVGVEKLNKYFNDRLNSAVSRIRNKLNIKLK